MQLSRIEGLLQVFQEEPEEETAQNPNRQEEIGLAGNPTRAVRGEAAAGDHAMQVGMVEEILTPRMEDREEPDLGPRCLGSAAMVRKVSLLALKRML